MAKNILISGVLGGIVMFVVMVAGRILLPGVGGSNFRAMPDQVQIHAALKARITEPGTYICPYLPPDRSSALFPDYLNEPIFAISYSGHTHGTDPDRGNPRLRLRFPVQGVGFTPCRSGLVNSPSLEIDICVATP